MTAYFISGLGADSTIFRNLRLPEEVSVKHIRWIEPGQDEAFKAYCRRLAAQVNKEEEIVLIGLSFGGLAAVELGRILNPKMIILISTIGTRKEMPLRLRFLSWCRLHRLLPAALLKWPNRLLYWFFGADAAEERALIRFYTENSSANYLRWAIDAVVRWQNSERPLNTFHIHGTKDRIFPASLTKAEHLVKDGGHLIVYNKAAEVSDVLGKKLKALQ